MPIYLPIYLKIYIYSLLLLLLRLLFLLVFVSYLCTTYTYIHIYLFQCIFLDIALFFFVFWKSGLKLEMTIDFYTCSAYYSLTCNMTEVTKICIILGILRFLKGREIRRCCFYSTFFLPVCVYLIMHYISLCALFFSPCMAVYEKKRKKKILLLQRSM